MFRFFSPGLRLVGLWAILIGVGLSIRPLFPIDETRYAAVAWEMWVRNDFLVPYLNGEAYSHKPPLLFWLMQLTWWLFGVNDWSLRLISPLFSLATLYLSQSVAKQLWPGRNQVVELTPFILLGFFFWMMFSSLIMFDIMLSFFALLGIYVLLTLVRSGLSLKRWALLGLALGGGALSKGPVIFLHVLPVALLAPWWLVLQKRDFPWHHWYGGLFFATLMGGVIALGWAIPAGIKGGEVYRNAIFLRQTFGRLVDSFSHKQPFWWYLQWLPIIWLPWVLMKPFWTGLARLDLQDFGVRVCLAWAVPVFVAFSLVSGKRIHYLLPLMPAMTLLAAWAFDNMTEFNWQRAHVWVMSALGLLGLVLMLLPWLNGFCRWWEGLPSISPVWGIALCISAVGLSALPAQNKNESVALVCLGSIITALVLAGGFFQINGKHYDTAPPAKKIAELMGEKRAIAFYGAKYYGQFHFTGRLTQAIDVISNANELKAFVNQQPNGYVLVEYGDSTEFSESILSYHYPYKDQNIGFVSCRALSNNQRLSSVFNFS
jgi:4-amino-4-deoxy-L-arabinose transferase-like glycosyltransferase